jgi:general secretion pathway protein A
MLSNFTRQGRALIQIFLLGQPEFRDRIGGDEAIEQLRQRVIASHHLEPMEANEIEPYIVHRLAVAGWQGRPAFSAEAFAALYRHSRGIPRQLNQLTARLLLHAGVEQLDRIGEGDVEAVAADLTADRPQPRERVLPLRSGSATQPRAASDAALDRTTERRIAGLEAQLEQQDAILRRVLTLLVDWVENGQQTPDYRTNAA